MARDQIEEVKTKTDIVEIIGERIELKKAGRNFKALCPFHGEKTPSFMVSPELQSFKCFGCTEGGDVFTFLEKYEGMEFSEALKYLADKAGVKLVRLEGGRGEKSAKEKLYEINALAQKFYHYVLTSHKAGSPALQYLLKERGIRNETIKTFSLGYCPNIPFAAKSFLVNKNKISLKDLVKVGIIYNGQRGSFDRFRGRVIFPLHDHRGNIIGFAGRILPGGPKKDLAKYINTPETPIYHKGSVLYGLNITRSEIKRQGEVIIVEGELDLISCWQSGIKNVVALKGTAMTEDQARLISRYAQKIIIALDSDLAGDMAARRGITIASNLGLSIKVLEIKGFKDPDEYARSSPEEFKKALKSAIGVWDFMIDSVFARHESLSGDNKGKIGREIIPILASIDDHIVQAHYAKVVADKLEVPPEAVFNQLNEAAGKSEVSPKAIKKEEKEPKVSRRRLLEQRLLALSFQSDPSILNQITDELVQDPLFAKIIRSFKDFKKETSGFLISEFSKKLAPELKDGFLLLSMMDLKGLPDKPDLLKKEMEITLKELKIIFLKEKLEQLAYEMKAFEADKDTAGLDRIEKRFSKYSRELSQLRAI